MNKKTALQLRSVLLSTLLLLLSLFSFSQGTFPVTGKITDNSGLPVEGVTVQEKGTQNIVITQKDGSFSMRTSSGNAILVVSSVGFDRQEIAIGNKSTVNST